MLDKIKYMKSKGKGRNINEKDIKILEMVADKGFIKNKNGELILLGVHHHFLVEYRRYNIINWERIYFHNLKSGEACCWGKYGKSFMKINGYATATA